LRCPPRTLVCVCCLIVLAVVASSSAQAYWTLDVGYYHLGTWPDYEWRPAGEAIAHLSNHVQFRVVLPAGANPAPTAVFAVHTTDPDDPWVILEADGHLCGSELGWLYLTPLVCTALTPDGEWQVWCQLIYPEPPGGGGGDSVTPGDPELEAVGEGLHVESWTPPPPPPYGWPDGFPCTDNGNNDYYLGPVDLTAKNLTVTALEIGSGGQPPFISPFVGVPAPPQGQQGSQVHYVGYVDDGNELTGEGPTSWELEDSLFLHLYPLGLGTDPGYAYGHFPLPDSFTGDWNAVAKGFYYVNLDVIEDEPPDWTQYISNVLSVGHLTRTGFTYTGPRAGRPTFQADVNDTRGDPHSIGDARYVWYHDDTATLTGGTAAGPSASGQDLTIEPATRTFGLAGTYRLGATFRDTDPPPIYHQQEHRWATPGVGVLDIPAAAHFEGSGFEGYGFDFCGYAYGMLGSVASDDVSRPTTFYSARYEEGVRGGVVRPNKPNRRANFISALKQDAIIHWSGHSTYLKVWGEDPPGWKIKEGIQPSPGDDVIWADEIGTLSREPQGAGKARLVYLDGCELLATERGWAWEGGQWVPYPISPPVFGYKVEERLADAVVSWTTLSDSIGCEAFDREFWDLLTQQKKTIEQAVSTALQTVREAHDDDWMVYHGLWESSDPVVPGVKAVGSGKGSPIGPAF